VKILSGLNMDDWYNKMLKKPIVEMAGWYQQFTTDTNKIEIYFMPARHWSRRGLTDTNKHLWGSFVIKANGKKIFFSGDTGYGSHLKEVGDMFDGIMLFALWVWVQTNQNGLCRDNHISPTNAVKAANEMKAKHFVPMHYGTFDLSDEPMGEPAQVLSERKK
jgi:L-ascorbate metabolism protein UlaG (beta-lactamase superfamily)